MTQRRLLDTNCIIRHLVQDHDKHARVAGKLFEACDHGELVLVVLSAVLSECVFVLQSFYKRSRTDTARVLTDLINGPGVEADDRDIHADALERYAKTKMHFVDCLIAAKAAAAGVPVATFDADFKKFPDVTVAVD